MRYRDGRRSICVSSQSGCPLTCTFCATGAMKFARNLSASEILDQALHFRRIEAIDHCVFMGMGEPMLNLDNVLAACERLPDIGVTHRRTDDLDGRLDSRASNGLREADMPLRLALSLHAADEALRSELMPVNERYPLARRDRGVPRVLRAQAPTRVRRVRDARGRQRPLRAGARARRRSRGGRAGAPPIFKVNLIPYNPTDWRTVRGVESRVDRRVPRRARVARRARHRAAHARARHRRRLRPARRQRGLTAVLASPPRASPARSNRSRSSACSSGVGSQRRDIGQLVEAAQPEQLQELRAWCGTAPRRTGSDRPPRSGRGRAAWRSRSRR